MTKSHLACLIALCPAFAAIATDPPTPSKKPEPWYVIPDERPTPPPPPPTPKATTLPANRLYVVQFKQPTFMVKPDAALVKVTEEAGPLTIQGLFVGGPDKVTTKKFAGPQVFVVEAVADGRTSITWVKKGAQTESDVLQRQIECVVAPQPPPIPPGPGPTPPPTPTTGPAWAIVVEQTEQRTPSQAAVLGNFAMWQALTNKGHQWRIFDADNPTAQTKGFVEAAKTVGLPALLIVGKSGKLISTQKLPETSTGVEEAMKKATGL